MKIITSLRNKFTGLIQAGTRYPLTMLFLLAIAIVNALSINNDREDYSKFLFTFLVGALLSAVSQQAYERFYDRFTKRLLLMGGAVLLSGGYYFAIRSASVFSIETSIKTAVTLFALSMAFIWVPTIKSKITFNDSFMSTFKAFFISLLFTAVIAGGISSIFFAIDRLLFSVDDKVTLHALNIVVSLFAPIFFLSFTPPYPGKMNETISNEELAQQELKVNKAISCPKNLEILISYIIIPLSVVYTVILLAYIVLNVRASFWTNNLLEPMLVSYAITVIIVYVLASTLENQFAALFRKIFPKILVPIVLFQTIASVLKIREMGITHGRYYVILFGIFAIISGLVFSFLPVKKNGIIAGVLIVFSAISIIPPFDAFTVSRVNQINLLRNVLVQNGMLENNTIVPKSSISNEDKKIITRTVSYIDGMKYTAEIKGLPANVFYSDNFIKTFGFAEVYDLQNNMTEGTYAYYDWNLSPMMNIEGYDRLIHMNVYDPKSGMSTNQNIVIEKANLTYTLTKKLVGDFYTISLVNENNEKLIQFEPKKLSDKILQESQAKKGILTIEEATVTQENDQVKMSILFNSIDSYNSQDNADFYIFLKIK